MKLNETEQRVINRNLSEIAQLQSEIGEKQEWIKRLEEQIKEIKEGAKWNTQETK